MATAKEVMGGGLSAGAAQAIGGGYNALTALGAGSVATDAAPVTASITVVSGADGSKGVVLPAGQVGDEVWLFNNAGSTCKVWPPAGSAICVPGTGLGTANAAYSQLTYKTSLYKYATSTQILVLTTA